MNFVLLFVFLIAGIGLGVLFNLFVIKNYPAEIRKGANAKAIVIFIIVAMVFFGLVTVRNIAISGIDNFANKTINDVNNKYSNLKFVTSGINMNDINSASNAITDIRKVIPSYLEVGIPSFAYNIVVNSVMNQVQTIITAADKTTNYFTDENNILSFSSFVSGVQRTIMKIVNISVLCTASITFILFAIYIINSLVTSSKYKKAAAA